MRHNIFYSFLIAAIVLLSGCTRSEIVDMRPVDDGSVTLNISLPAPVSHDMTRSVPDGYNTINDLNIIIATAPRGSGSTASADDAVVRYAFYLGDGAINQAGIDGAIVKPEWVDYTGDGTNHGIHFEKEWFNFFAIDASECAFFLVANNGSPISAATVGELRAIKAVNQFVMFGESEPVAGNHGHANGRSLQVNLERLVAMVTVKIDGGELDGRIQITPRKVSLYNVPQWCLIDEDNVITENDRFTPKSGAVMPGQSHPVTWGSIARGSSPVGGHYTEADDIGDDNTIWNKATVQPLFLFENYHGSDFGENVTVDDQAYKRPAERIVGSYSDDTPTEDEISEVTGACSYLQIFADYYNGNTGEYGNVTYRVFLGENETTSFDVMRNTYYRFTLKLSRTGISERDYSWRVDADLGTMEISNSDYTFNGDGSIIDDLNILDADGKQVVCEIISSTPNFASNPWIFLANDSNAWTALNELSGNRGHLPDNPDGAGFRAWLYISPMIRGSQSWPANSSGIKREVVFRCHKHNNENQTTPDITITQYEPISAEINGQRVYIDRVDREEMPWGFENVQINNNQSSGFENGYWLMVNRWNTQPNPANGYRPFGGGSVMMTAAFGHHFHVDGVPNFNTTNVNNGTFPANATRPANGSYAYAVPSRAEWKLLEQMDIFDPSFPVGSWDRYWTSDAVTELDSRESYIYQKGYGEQTAPRTEMLKSRMIFMRAPVPAVLAPAE